MKHRGLDVPFLLYGTAWKEADTKQLTQRAIELGFRGIDTANQRKHYFEEAVGQAVQASIAKGLVQRAQLFLQTKFTFQSSQDHRLPYDPRAPIAEQVASSFESSLQHFATDVIDSYVLHGPSRAAGLTDDDWQAWQAMESLYRQKKAKALGVSNVSAEQLELLCRNASVMPAFVQNRCYARRAWDADVRAICRAHDIVYQGFSLLTANPRVLTDPVVVGLAKRHHKTEAQIVFRFAIEVGMLPLTGTTAEAHMRDDLQVQHFSLSPEEVREFPMFGERTP